MRTFKFTIPTMGDISGMIVNHLNLREWFIELKEDQHKLQRRIVALEHGAPAGIVEKVDAIAIGLGSKADSELADERHRGLESRIEWLEKRDAILTSRCDALCRQIANLEANVPKQLHKWRKHEADENFECDICGEALTHGESSYTLCKGPKRA